MFSCKVHDLRHLGLGNFVCVNTALADAVMMDMEHNADRRFMILVEESLQHLNDKLHRRIIVVEQQHPVEARLLGLRLGLGNNRGAGSV